MLPFFKSILGEQGVGVMESLEKASEDLSSYITPRVIVSWLRQADYGNVDLPVNCPISALVKSGYGYSGASNIDGQLYTFQYVTEEHVAAIITTAAGQKLVKTETKALDLARLAKTIDLLVKANKQLQYERTQHVQPLEPEGFDPPNAVQPKQVAKPQLKKIAIPCVGKKKKKKLSIWKSEISKPCSLCGQHLFENDEFVGCTCFKPLSKSVTSTSDKVMVTLEFEDDIDQDAMLALIGALKHGR